MPSTALLNQTKRNHGGKDAQVVVTWPGRHFLLVSWQIVLYHMELPVYIRKRISVDVNTSCCPQLGVSNPHYKKICSEHPKYFNKMVVWPCLLSAQPLLSPQGLIHNCWRKILVTHDTPKVPACLDCTRTARDSRVKADKLGLADFCRQTWA